MKSSRKNRVMETYRENHLTQMKKKISKELIHHSLEEDSSLTILRILIENKKERERGEK
jgi:hypothetical protein